MEFRSRNNQPQPLARPASAAPAARPSFEGSDMDNTMPVQKQASFTPPTKPAKSKKMMIIVGAVIVVLLLGAGWYAKRMIFSSEGAIQGDKFQAIFLTNGQVYFGKLAKVDDGYASLTNVYYLQVQQQVQPADNKDQKQPQVSLTKLGSELHGPDDSMHISRDQILFWENLKDDSKVVQAIKDHQKK